MMTSNKTIFRKSILPWIMFAMGALYYCYAYFLRVSPSVMMNELVSHFQITAAQFGNLTAFYYYAYTPMQLPVGVIVDRFGARKVLVCACLIAVSGLALFIKADTLHLAAGGRFLIGFGSAFAYITVLKLVALWLPPNRFATAAGLTSAFGMTAGMLSQIYLATFVQKIGYKNALFTGLIAGLGLVVLLFLVVRDRPKDMVIKKDDRMTFRQSLRGLRLIFMNKETWYIGIVGCLLYLPASVFLDLWGIPYLETVYNLTAKQAAQMLAMVFIGWIIAGPIIGAASDIIKLRRMPLIVTSFFSGIFICMIFYIPGLPNWSLYLILFLFGVTCGSHPLVFSLSREKHPTRLSGTATATTNFFIMSGGVIFQPLVGMLLDWHWSGNMVNHVRTYTTADYNFALAVVPIGLFLSCVIALLIKETYCEIRPTYEIASLAE